MSLVNSDDIIDIFTLLNKSKLNYIVIRNINSELPCNLKNNKDIDILIQKKDRSSFLNFFNDNKYKKIIHPHRNNVFLYGVDKFEFYKNDANVLFDLNFQIAVRSLDAGQWIPLDITIQESAWKNKRFKYENKDFAYWILSYDDEFICLIARSIFDKKEFQDGYIKRINELFIRINQKEVTKKLNMVFFKFTPFLMKMIEKKEFTKIVTNYLLFKEY